MSPIEQHFASLVIAVSEVFAAWVIFKLWRSDEITFLKIALTTIAIIPLLGPLLVLWISNFPERAPEALQDRYKFGADVHERWDDVIRESNPVAKFKKWRDIMKR